MTVSATPSAGLGATSVLDLSEGFIFTADSSAASINRGFSHCCLSPVSVLSRRFAPCNYPAVGYLVISRPMVASPTPGFFPCRVQDTLVAPGGLHWFVQLC